jgi:hypothetical protein
MITSLLPQVSKTANNCKDNIRKEMGFQKRKVPSPDETTDVLSLSHRTHSTYTYSLAGNDHCSAISDWNSSSSELPALHLDLKYIDGPPSILKPFSSSLAVREQGPWKRLPKPDMHRIRHRYSNPTKEGPKKDRTVCFDCVMVRHYAQTLGDNPSVPCGPPIQLDWIFEEQSPIDIDEYEGNRLKRWIHPLQMTLSQNQRQNILSYYFGFTQDELDAAGRSACRIRHQRKMTIVLQKALVVEDFLGSAARKTKRMVAWQKAY